MSQKATGTFEVSLVPQTDKEVPMLGRLTLEKTFAGDLEATSQGQMLSARTSIPNSAGYVAIERVEGTLHGKKGSFVLQHSGTMNRGASSLQVTIVPDSGTGELEGISGTLAIIIADGKHSYELSYEVGSMRM
jgi:hypothetical protein